jgi:hypothetical protein
MTTLDWTAFESLPGSQTGNFEKLCRALVRCHYGGSGVFFALANQPGVEFHLRLHTKCSLGDQDRWFGWQCRWYDLPAGKALGSARRNKIAEALAKSATVVPGMTDWVLWTRHTLTAGDQKWLRSLKTRLRLHLWTSAEVEDLLAGEGLIFRETYFGELILTPKILQEKHAEAVAWIKQRWQPEVHQVIDAERTIRRMLGEGQAWKELDEVANALKRQSNALPKNDSRTPSLGQLVRQAVSVADGLLAILKCIGEGDLDLLTQQFETPPTIPFKDMEGLLRTLRAKRDKSALVITNLLADMRSATILWADVKTNLTANMVAVLAGPGGGKTQLSAQLTAATTVRPPGILLYGRDLHVGHNLDTLANTVVIHGNQVQTMERLIAAVNAAGQRSRTRLPIVIDGLNEAEDPRKWHAPLAALTHTLRKYPHVLVVCTIRDAFANESLPPDVKQIMVEGFGEDAYEAIRRYFHYYKINSTDADLPIELLNTPLSLRMFCEVTNPARKKEVGIEAMPGSLSTLFERYLEEAGKRINELAANSQRYFEQDIRAALDKFGEMLWNRTSRYLNEKEFRQAIGDDARPWDKSLVHAMEEEGVLMRVPAHHSPGLQHLIGNLPTGNGRDEMAVVGVFDMLAGHIIADHLVRTYGSHAFESWIRQPENQQKVTAFLNHAHPLASDIFLALVALLPRRLHRQQLWLMLNESLRTRALRKAAELEGTYLDQQTVDELRSFGRLIPTNGVGDLFARLYRTRSSPAHPLNAEFLDTLLRPMAMRDRDMRWTEWVRRNKEEILKDIESRERLWRLGELGGKRGRLTAQWMMWILTSTVRPLRDHATRALYWFGRTNPAELFALTLDSLGINDPYVGERMLAASYGTAMALHHSQAEDFTRVVLPDFAMRLYAAMFSAEAAHATTHALARDYARHTISLALLHTPKLLSHSQKERIRPPFPGMKRMKWEKTGVKFSDSSVPVHMDFGNYTIGGLVAERGNYDYENPEYQEVIQSIHWRIYDLGYDDARFRDAEDSIGNENWHGGRGEDPSRTDRYGKKYSWIAYFEMAGDRSDRTSKKPWRLNEPRLPAIDIDPSFPDPPPERKMYTNFLGAGVFSFRDWLQDTKVPRVAPYLVMPSYESFAGPWVLLAGYLIQTNEAGCRLFCQMQNVMAKQSVFRELYSRLKQGDAYVESFLETPRFTYTFVGEAAWADTYPACALTDVKVRIGTKRVKQLVTPISEILSSLSAITDGVRKVEIERVKTFEFHEVPIFRTIKALIPTISNDWETYHSTANSGHNPKLIGHELCGFLKLHVNQQTSEFFDSEGAQASLVVKSGSNSWKASQEFIFLRKDLYDRFLRAKGLRALWLVRGTREVDAHHSQLQDIYKQYGGPVGFRDVISYAFGRGQEAPSRSDLMTK